MADCEATSPNGQPCRLEGDHDPHAAGYGNAYEIWPNPDYVPAYTRPVPSEKGLYDKAKAIREAKAAAEEAARPSVDRDVVHLPAEPQATSVIAAQRVLPKTGSNRRLVYDYIAAKGEEGATDDEMIGALEMLHQTETPSRYSLMKDGLIVDSGQRRDTRQGNPAIVWVVAP